MSSTRTTVATTHWLVSILIFAAPFCASAEVPNPPVQICIDDSTNCTAGPTSSTKGIKWHPGHYAETQSYGSISNSAVADIASLPKVQGVVQRYYWSQLEPTRGNYDFSAIHADLAKLRPHGKRLIPLLMDRAKGSGTGTALPRYLATEPGSNNGIVMRPGNNGVIARLWNSAVMDREIALSAAMAAEFDDEPLFEGLRFPEITAGMTPGADGVPSDYTIENMISQYKRLATAARQHWKHTNVFMNTNSLGGEYGPLQIIEHNYQIGGVGAGGPDVLPPAANDHQLAGDRVIARSPDRSKGDDPAKFLRDYRGTIPVLHSVQTPELGGKEGTFLPAELADYIILHVGETHMSWVMAPSSVKINWASYIKPYLAGNPRPTNQACPTRYAAGCDTR